MNEIRVAARQLLKNPGFATVAVLTLALGIGANTAIFSVLNSVLLKPLPYPSPGRLVWVSERGPGSPSLSLSYPNFEDWQAQQTVFEDLGAYMQANLNLTQEGDPLRLQAAYMSSGALAAFHIQPVLGRLFSPADDKSGAASTVVLSHALWQARFGARADILNRSITLDDQSHTVIGIMPPGFAFPTSVDLWMSMGALVGTPRLHYQERGYHSGFFAVARLKDRVSIEQARLSMDAIARRLEQQYPEDRDLRVRLDPLLDNYVSGFRRTLWTLLGAVGLVLLIACGNVANLLLARAATRQKEMALRAALGAGAWRLVRQSVAEGLVLSVLGGAFGVLLARLTMPLIINLAQGRLPRAAEASLNGGVLIFASGLALLTGFIFGLVPACQASRADLQKILNATARGTTGGRTSLRHGLVVAEVGTTLLLLVSAGLLLRSFQRLQHVNPGFNHQRVLSFRFDLPEQKYPTEEQRSSFYQALLGKLRVLPGVQSASVISRIPLEPIDDFCSPFLIEGETTARQNELPQVDLAVVSPDYFQTLGIPLVRGRAFTETDDRRHLEGKSLQFRDPGDRWMAGLSKLIIDEEFARRYWPNQDPIGRKVRLPWRPGGVLVEVIGVVGHVKLDQLSEPVGLVQGYLSYLEAPRRGMAVVLRTTLAPETLVASVRAQLLALDPQQPLYEVRTLAEIRDTSIAPQRLNVQLLGVFAALALILASIGLYGVLAYSVTQRHRELGVRIALGAQRSDVLKLILGQGMSLTLVGMFLGVAGSFAVTRLLSALLYEIHPTDPLTLICVCLILSFTALLACLIPARRATKVDPIEALRYE